MLLASVLDNGDAGVLAAAPGVTDAGSVHALLDQLMEAGSSIGEVVIRVVTTPDARALADARWAACAFSAAGHPLDAIVVSRVPMARDGWPKAWATAQRVRVEGFAAASPVPVLPLRLRPAARVTPRSMPLTPARPRPVTPAPEATATGFRWQLPIDGIADVRALQVGQDAGQLILDLDGARIRRPLPSVLARCLATQAQETDAGVVVDFARDPRLWPEGRA